MPASVSITEARKKMASLFSDAVIGHRPSLIEKQREAGLLLGVEEAAKLVAGCKFHPEVFFEEGAVSIWLPELALYGRGADYEAAEDDLLDEVREYADEYWADIHRYLAAPNRESHFPYLIRAVLSDRRGELRDVLFAAPEDSGAQRGGLVASA